MDGAPDASRRRAALMAAAQLGDARSYGELLNDVGPMVFAFLRRRVRDADDCQDAYQDVLLALHRARHTYDPHRPLEPWLFAIARYVLSARERRARRAFDVALAEPPEPAVAADGDTRVRLEQAVRDLPRAQREAMVLLYVDGLPLEVAAERAGTTTGALKVRAHRAYRALRRLLTA